MLVESVKEGAGRSPGFDVTGLSCASSGVVGGSVSRSRCRVDVACLVFGVVEECGVVGHCQDFQLQPFTAGTDRCVVRSEGADRASTVMIKLRSERLLGIDLCGGSTKCKQAHRFHRWACLGSGGRTLRRAWCSVPTNRFAFDPTCECQVSERNDHIDYRQSGFVDESFRIPCSG